MCAVMLTDKRRRYVAFRRFHRHNDGIEDIMPKSMTDKDQDLLALLRLNAREPVASLARKLTLSRTTVQDRLRKLEESGAIAGYAVKLGKEGKSNGISAMITLGVEPKRQIEMAKLLSRIPQVETLYTVSGKIDFVAMVKTATSEDMDRLIDQFGQLPGVSDIETAVILSTKLDRR
jgi:DNA-binding Lrp family transcriptional regulator